MATVRLTVRQLDKLGLWERVREYKGWNPYIRNEGQIREDEIVEFDDEFKKEAVKYKYYTGIEDMGLIYSDYILKKNDTIELNDKSYLVIDFADDDGEELILSENKVYRVYSSK